MKLMKKSKIFISAFIISWLVQGCSSSPESESPALNSTIEKSAGGAKIYRKAPASDEILVPQRSPSTDLDGGISGTGHENKLDQGKAF